MDTWANIPILLRKRPQWVNWRMVTREGRPTKVPICPRDGRWADSTAPATWHTFGAALQRARKTGEGIGFVLTPPWVGVDLDRCIDDNGELSDLAVDTINNLYTYTEITPSGRGIHCLMLGTLPGPRRHHKVPGKEVEMYTQGRFFTMTGHRYPGTPDRCYWRRDALGTLYRTLFPAVAPQPIIRRIPCTDPLSDTAILRIAFGAKNGLKFARLWGGDCSDYAGNHSLADSALCSLLGWYSGGDAAQVDRLFRASGLMRSKWDSPRPHYGTYGARTVTLALQQLTSYFGSRRIA